MIGLTLLNGDLYNSCNTKLAAPLAQSVSCHSCMTNSGNRYISHEIKASCQMNESIATVIIDIFFYLL